MTVDRLMGRLLLRPGHSPSVVCERPMIGAALLGRLTAGRRAALLPGLLATVFTLGAQVQHSTAARAVKAALGLHAGHTADAISTRRDALVIAMHTAREHLQRLALDWPTLVMAETEPPTPAWLRNAPVMVLPASAAGPGEASLQAAAVALPGWLERHLLGMPPARWLQAWHAERGDWLRRWCADRDHPVPRWLHRVRGDAQSVAWPCRALDVLHDAALPTDGLHALGAALAADAHFAEQPQWQGAPAETGSWTRAGRSEPVLTLWDRLGARLADLARIADGVPLAFGALALGDGQGLAWTEMSRGLLVHWVQLEDGERQPDTARAARYHVLAPTEWNFHPAGAFARLLAGNALNEVQARLAAATLDPCIEFSVDHGATQRA
jgi:hypothetical protein